MINISRKTFYHYRNKEMKEKEQQIRQNEKERNHKAFDGRSRRIFSRM